MAAHIETGTMVHPTLYSSKQLDHLGLVAGMCDELGIAELIDKLIPQDTEKRKVSVGQAVKAMILNGLGFANRALYLTELFFRDKPVDRLIGEGIEAEHLNDDTLGRTLDVLYTAGVNKVYSPIALSVVKQLELQCRFGHMDSTSFHVDGNYNSDEAPENGVIHITKGYSRDHRPDLNQLTLQLLAEGQAGIPLLMQTLNGNNSDKESFRETCTEPVEVWLRRILNKCATAWASSI
jgi:transposase